MRKLQLRDYNYSTRKTKEERAISIEQAVFDYGTDKVIQYMTTIQQHHPIIKEDLQELKQRKDDIEDLKNALEIEKSYFHNKKIRQQIIKIYDLIDDYDKAINPNKKTPKWSYKTRQTLKRLKSQKQSLTYVGAQPHTTL